MGFDFGKMMSYEQGAVCLMEKMLLTYIHGLLNKEWDYKNLEEYL